MPRFSKKDERGSLALWFMGLGIMLLLAGGISVDLWRAYTARRSFASTADAMAIAGASGVDEQHFRENSVVKLDQSPLSQCRCTNSARDRAYSNLAEQKGSDPNLSKWINESRTVVNVSDEEVEVTIYGDVSLTLLGMLANFDGSTPEDNQQLPVASRATARVNAIAPEP